MSSDKIPDMIAAIRRIAKTDPDIQRGLAVAKQKAPIPTARGVAYRNADGDIRSGSDVPDDAAKSGSSDGTGSKKQGDDQHNVGDVMDLPTGAKVGELDAVDCATGDKIKIDLFPADGAEYVTPDGWSDPDTPPVVDGYDAGYYWETSRAGSQASHPEGVVVWYEANVTPPPVSGHVWQGQFRYTPGTYLWIEALWKYGETLSWLPTDPLMKRSCGASIASYCTVSPEQSEWPSNNQIDLALTGGKFTAHSMDPDAPSVYKDSPPSAIEICDGDGNRYQVRPRHNGGVQITELNPDGTIKDPGNTKLIDRDGIVEDTIDSKFRQYHI